MLVETLAVFLMALAGGCFPLFFRWSERLLHASLALATGIFLGAVFFHLLPAVAAADLSMVPQAPGAVGAEEVAGGAGLELQGAPEVAEQERPPHHPSDVTAWVFVLVGVLGVYLVESLVLRTQDHDDLHRHRGVSYAALMGLSFHSFAAGLAYPAFAEGAAGSAPIFIAIFSHQGLESFSLATVFQLAAFGRRAIAGIVVLFSLVTPLGILAGSTFVDRLPSGGSSILSALAAGTFLYVCLGELLPEVFHHREDSVAKIGLLVLGIGSMLLLHAAGA